MKRFPAVENSTAAPEFYPLGRWYWHI